MSRERKGNHVEQRRRNIIVREKGKGMERQRREQKGIGLGMGRKR